VGGGFRQVLAVREFRWLWIAGLQSLVGDQLARVALSVLVFQHTKSGVLTSGVYALTFLPALVGSIVLGPLADRLPRRALLVGADLIRMVLLAIMSIPGVPLGVIAVLLVVAVAVGTPWNAAESALIADILEGKGYALGTGLRVATVQGAQVAGFAFGGIAVAAIGARTGLALDAASFAISAALIAVTVAPRPPVASSAAERGVRAGVRVLLEHRPLLVLLALSWLSGLLVVPEGLAAPYAAKLGGSSAATGLLLAAGPAGTLVGSLVFVRLLGEHRRHRLLGPLAVLAGAPLIGCLARPGLVVTLALWATCGLCGAYQVQVITEFVQAVPTAVRGQAISVASAGVLVVQGLGLVAGGLLADVTSIFTTVGLAGAASCLIAIPLAAAHRDRPGLHRRRPRIGGPH
jgi:predicted MFS family arabinose efflux permease